MLALGEGDGSFSGALGNSPKLTPTSRGTLLVVVGVGDVIGSEADATTGDADATTVDCGVVVAAAEADIFGDGLIVLLCVGLFGCIATTGLAVGVGELGLLLACDGIVLLGDVAAVAL